MPERTIAASIEPRARPLSFAAAMIRAILSDRKTQTRRLVRPQPQVVGRDEKKHPAAFADGERITCPFGSPGDLLWARERWAYARQLQNRAAPDGGLVMYAADDGAVPGRHWRQSRYMPRAASRFSLRVLAVRIERLNQISEADARAEGFDPSNLEWPDPQSWFADLWDSLCTEEGTFWRDNPWVWVVDFERTPSTFHPPSSGSAN